MDMNDNVREVLVKIGGVLKIRRKELKISQEKLANSIGIDRKHLSAIENGRQNMTLSTLWKVCNALEITVIDVFDRMEK